MQADVDARATRVRPTSDSPCVHSEEEPPLQRRKYEASTDAAPGSTPAVRDEKYYRDDGDCIIQVENTLFKIHRYHLSGDSDIFRSMFSLPAGGRPLEGQSDLYPIVLFGDTPAQLRAVLSFSYSNPNQLQINRMSIDDLDRLLNMVPFAHKYFLQQCLLWALESMEHILMRSASVMPAEKFPVILEVTALCTSLHAPICQRICDLIQHQWMAQIKSDALPIGPALETAERSNLRSFLIALYRIVLDKLADMDLHAAAGADGLLAGINATHQLRIFSGSWALARCWRDFLTQPSPAPVIPRACITPQDCEKLWRYEWRKQIQRVSTTSEGSPACILRQAYAFRSAMTNEIRAGSFCCG
ncbi:hypothetical protein B0H15DRAFT_890753 [Mycena belliarum]|uniref:BTB domain-containing protein n=1 Tax=Mycena belliarum TaxID=1033014 RepID=A0AAD6XM24_9AGAR|nr:hypothetical protein B0H15DRAFT_890753 [Mycena belliae]